MAFTEAERVQIRRYMCWQVDAITIRYDALITRIQAKTEGGAMEDNSTELYVRNTILANLARIEAKLVEYLDQMQAASVGSLQIDPVRASAAVRAEGRRWVHALSRALSAKPQADAFGPTPQFEDRNPMAG